MESHCFPAAIALLFPPPPPTSGPWARLYTQLVEAKSLAKQLAVCHDFHRAISTLCSPRRAPSSEAASTCCLFALSVYVVVDQRNIGLHTALQRIVRRLYSALQKLLSVSAKAPSATSGDGVITNTGEASPPFAVVVARRFTDALMAHLGAKHPGDMSETGSTQSRAKGSIVWLSRLLLLKNVARAALQSDGIRVAQAIECVVSHCVECSHSSETPQHSLRGVSATRATHIVARLWELAVGGSLHSHAQIPASLDNAVVHTLRIAESAIVAQRTDSAAGHPELQRAYRLLGFVRGLNSTTTDTPAGETSTAAHAPSTVTSDGLKHFDLAKVFVLSRQTGEEIHGTTASKAMSKNDAQRWTALPLVNRVAVLGVICEAPSQFVEFGISSASTVSFDAGPMLRAVADTYAAPMDASVTRTSMAEWYGATVGQLLQRLTMSSLSQHDCVRREFEVSSAHVAKSLFAGMPLVGRGDMWKTALGALRGFVTLLRQFDVQHVLEACVQHVNIMPRNTHRFFDVVSIVLCDGYGVGTQRVGAGGGTPPIQLEPPTGFTKQFPRFFKASFQTMVSVPATRNVATALLRKIYVTPLCRGIRRMRTKAHRPSWLRDAADALASVAFSDDDGGAASLLLKVLASKDHVVETAVLCELGLGGVHTDNSAWAAIHLLKSKQMAHLGAEVLCAAHLGLKRFDAMQPRLSTVVLNPASDIEVRPQWCAALSAFLSTADCGRLLQILAQSVVCAAFSSRAYVVEALIELSFNVLRSDQQHAHLAGADVFVACLRSLIPLPAPHGWATAAEMLSWVTSPSHFPTAAAVYKAAITIALDTIMPASPFNVLLNAFELLQLLASHKQQWCACLDASQKLRVSITDKCLRGMSRSTFPAIVSGAQKVFLSVPAAHATTRQFKAEVRQVLEKHAVTAGKLLDSLHAEYYGAAVCIHTLMCIHGAMADERFSIKTLTQTLEIASQYPGKGRLQHLFGTVPTANLHGPLALLALYAQHSKYTAVDNAMLLRAVSAARELFVLACFVMQSRCTHHEPIRSPKLSATNWQFAVDCRGHPFAVISDLEPIRPCPPVFATKVWLLMKEATSFLMAAAMCHLSSHCDSEYLVNEDIVAGICAQFDDALRCIKHKGAVSVISSALGELRRRQTSVARHTLVKQIVGTSTNIPRQLIPRRDCGMSAMLAMRIHTTPKPTSTAVDVVRWALHEFNQCHVIATGSAAHTPPPFMIHTLYCMLVAIGHLRSSVPEHRSVLSDIVACLARVCVFYGSWNLINASMLVLAAVVKTVTDRHLSVVSFQQLYPAMHAAVVRVLQRFAAGSQHALVNTSGRNNIVFSCLLLFSKFRSVVGEPGDRCVICATSLLPLLDGCLSSPLAAIRRVCAEAMSKLLPMPLMLETLMELTRRTRDSNAGSNTIHGTLLRVHEVVQLLHNSRLVCDAAVTSAMHVLRRQMLSVLSRMSDHPLCLSVCVRSWALAAEFELPSACDSMGIQMCSAILQCMRAATGSSAIVLEDIVRALTSPRLVSVEGLRCVIDALQSCTTNLTSVILSCVATVHCASLLRLNGELQRSLLSHAHRAFHRARIDDAVASRWADVLLVLRSIRCDCVGDFPLRVVPKLSTVQSASCVELGAHILLHHMSAGTDVSSGLRLWLVGAENLTMPEMPAACRRAVIRSTRILFPQALRCVGVEVNCILRFAFNVVAKLIQDNDDEIRLTTQTVVLKWRDHSGFASALSVDPRIVLFELYCTLRDEHSVLPQFWTHVQHQFKLAEACLTKSRSVSRDVYEEEDYCDFCSPIENAMLLLHCVRDSCGGTGPSEDTVRAGIQLERMLCHT